MNILWVASPLTDTRGGALTVTRNLMKGLDKDFHTYLGSCEYMGMMFEENGGNYIKSFSGYEPVTINNWLLMPLSFVLGFVQVLKHKKLYENTDKVIVATAHTEVFFTIPWVLLWFKKPIIIMNHTGRCPQSLYKNPFKFIMRWVYNHSKVVFVSKAHREMWEKYHLMGKQSTALYNGVQIQDFEPKKKRMGDSAVFGFLGRIEEEKGLDTLFEALELINTDTQITVYIAGEGKDQNKYQTWSKKIMKTNSKISINLLGQISDKNLFFENVDCLIFPTKFESFGLVMVEAWERGVPVICSDIPALTELKSFTNNLEESLMFETANKNDLAHKILLFIQHFSDHMDMEHSIYLHSVAQTRFSLDSQINKFKSLIYSK